MDPLYFKHILVPVDFSAASLNAMDTAAVISRGHGAKLTPVHVVNKRLLSF
ncbi:MAG: universal stress protein [Saprospiraceae bacterium]|nr:universal stress protein [Saprospiraceae bacterium]